MNSFQIKCFLCIADNMSFSNAADELFIAQSAISRHISNLEKELGVLLFNRHGRSISLTAAGQDFKEIVQGFNQSIQHLLNTHVSNHIDSRELRFSLFPVWHIPDLFLENAQQIEATTGIKSQLHYISARDLSDELFSGNIDILFHNESMIQNLKGIAAYEITKIPRIVLFSKKHPLASRSTPLTLADFKDATFLCVTDKSCTIEMQQQMHNKFCEQYNFQPKLKPVSEPNNLLLQLETTNNVALMDYWSRHKLNNRLRYIVTEQQESVVAIWRSTCNNYPIERYVAETASFFQRIDE